jgi:2'-5' RNA ligase
VFNFEEIIGMHIDTQYKQLWTDALARFQKNEFEFDPLIDDATDQRFGLTIVIRPSQEVKASIEALLNAFRQIEPGQYYYPTDDMHVTVLSIVSCYNGFTRQSYTAKDYLKVIEKSLPDIHHFKIHFQGITASPGCVMVQGYPEGMLNLLRTNLRNSFKHTGLQTSFDKRYRLEVAHSTVVRFRNKINDKQKFINLLEHYRRHEFGTSMVNEIEFVFNDWYLRKDRGETIARFALS